jgi:glycosyltransferase involved in cell wall biosynthesis
MKLLVLAHTPPPLHGQSVMVQTLLTGLPGRGITVHHVNLRLSADSADIGRWRPGKIFSTFGFALRAIAARFRHGADTLYYVPAPPAKRGALYRDWTILALCRPFFRRLVLHWHAAGLGEWIETDANAFERAVTRCLLGRADLALVLGEALRRDGELLDARKIAVVPNGIDDPGANPPSTPTIGPCQLLFLALGSEEKGLFAAAAAVIAANRRLRRAASEPAFVLVAAGPFDGFASASRFADLAKEHPTMLWHVGMVGSDRKRQLFAATHALCFPTRYRAEALPLAAIEALAHDRPVIATAWRGLPDIVTPETGVLVPPGDEAALIEALLQIRAHRPAPGICRARFLERFTVERHLDALAAALRKNLAE